MSAWRAAALSGIVAAALIASAGAAGAAGDGKRQVSVGEITAHDAHARPPSRLWYRIQVRFQGHQVRGSTGPSGTATVDHRVGYRLRANAATLLMASCRSPRVEARNRSCAEVRREIRGRFRGARRTRLLRGLRETYSFRANMTGEIIGAAVRSTVDPVTSTSPAGERVPCMPSSQTTASIQANPQRATGVVQSRGGSGSGVIVQATRRGTSARQIGRTSVTCQTFKDDPPTFTIGGDSMLQVPWVWHALDRGVLSFIGGKELSEHLAFSGRPGRFGRSFSINRTIRENGPRRDPSGALDTGQKSRTFQYTLIFRVCGRGGRVPRGC